MAARGFGLICDPVPVTDAFQSYGGSPGKAREEGRDGAGMVLEADSIEQHAGVVLDLDLGVMLVGIAIHGKLLHKRPLH